MKISLGILKEIDFNFWVNSNDFYSPDILSTDGLNHTKKAGLINDLIKTLNSNEELIKLIEQRITEKDSASAYTDEDLLIIFDLIQGWGGRMGRNPYVFQNAPRINKSELFASIYRESVEMLYQLNVIEDYEKNIAPIKNKFEELPQVGESFSTKHLSFWSRFLKNCPELVIYDSRMKNLIEAANKDVDKTEITYNDFYTALKNNENELGLDINNLERAIFGFSLNYFLNDKLVLVESPKIDHADKAIAYKLTNDTKI